MTNPREQGTKPLGSVKCRKSLGQLNDTRPLNKNSVPKWSKAECTKYCQEPDFLLRTPPSETSTFKHTDCRRQWPSGRICRFVVARLLGLRVRMLLGTWMSVSCGCCVCQVEVSASG